MSASSQDRACYFGSGSGFKMRPVYNSGKKWYALTIWPKWYEILKRLRTPGLTHRVPAHVYIHSCQKSMLSGHGCQPNEPIIWLKFFWKLGYNLSFRALDWFSSTWGQNCGSKNKNWMKIQVPQRVTLAIICQLIELESCTNPIKTQKGL